MEKVPFGKDDRLWISIDWTKVKTGKNEGTIKIAGAGSEVNVELTAIRPDSPAPESLDGFAEGNGYVSMEAEHFSINSKAGERVWTRIEDYGHTLSGMRASAPADAVPAVPGQDSPCLEYKMYIFNPGDLEVTAIFSPTLNFMPGRDLRYAISFDDQKPAVTTLVPGDYNAQNRNADWEKSVSDNARFSLTKHNITTMGYHTLKIWMVDPGPVLQKIIVNTGGLKPSYLGPSESFNNKIMMKNN